MTDILTINDVLELLSGAITGGLILTAVPWALGMVFVGFKKIIL